MVTRRSPGLARTNSGIVYIEVADSDPRLQLVLDDGVVWPASIRNVDEVEVTPERGDPLDEPVSVAVEDIEQLDGLGYDPHTTAGENATEGEAQS